MPEGFLSYGLSRSSQAALTITQIVEKQPVIDRLLKFLQRSRGLNEPDARTRGPRARQNGRFANRPYLDTAWNQVR